MKNMYRSILLCSALLFTTFVFAQNPVIQSILDDVEVDSMLKFVGDISGENPVFIDGNWETITSRHKLNVGNALTTTYLFDKFTSFGLQPYYQNWSSTLDNVIAEQEGVLYPNKKVIICGHYDAMPGGIALAPAADDDGSGTAAVLEAARVLSQYQFEYTIVYALWDEEEQGLIGSGFYAGAAASNDDTIIAVINLDAIAWDGDGDSLASIHTRPIANSIAIGDTAFAMNSRYNLDLALNINNPGATYSDHASFWSEGYSAILIIEDFDNDGNPHYHTETDLVQYFDVPYFEKVAKLGFATVATLAVPFDGNIGVEESSARGWLNARPNPFTDVVRIDLPESANGSIRSVELFDSMGKSVENVDYTLNGNSLVIEGIGLSTGLYTLSIVTEDGNMFAVGVIKR